jgi:hypothetical protein
MFFVGAPHRFDEGPDQALLYMNSDYLSDVGVLYRNVFWHGVLPFLFVFVYFFTATRNLALRARGLKASCSLPRIGFLVTTVSWLS